MINTFRKIYNPSLFQGHMKKSRYFEGWFFKMVSAGFKKIALIPGISLVGRNHPDNHSFIQMITEKGMTDYFRYKLSDFWSNPDKFEISVGKSTFSDNGIIVDITGQGRIISGKVDFTGLTRLPVSLFTPGIMGWYRFIPFMQCYHGLISMNHSLEGEITDGAERIVLSGGKGYIEKDWGSSFPRSYIWLQSNHFRREDISVMLSVAEIPWLNGFFIGFLAVVAINGKILRFTTYSGAKVLHLEVSDEQITCSIEDKDYQLTIASRKGLAGPLKAPETGSMVRIIHESLDATVNVFLKEKRTGTILIDDQGLQAGREVSGNTRALMDNYSKKRII